jgi:hypothetical protein
MEGANTAGDGAKYVESEAASPIVATTQGGTAPATIIATSWDVLQCGTISADIHNAILRRERQSQPI